MVLQRITGIMLALSNFTTFASASKRILMDKKTIYAGKVKGR
jgi:hypothetical protein